MKLSKIIRTVQITLLIISLVVLDLSIKLSGFPASATLEYVNNEIVSHSWHDFYEKILAIILLVQIALLLALIIADIVNKIRNKVRICKSVSFTVFLVAFSFMTSGLSFTFMDDSDNKYNPQYYMFTDNSHTIVIEERSFLMSGRGTVYQIHNDNKAEVIGSINTDDGGRNYGNYDIEWSQEYAEITYSYCDTENSRKTEKVYFS